MNIINMYLREHCVVMVSVVGPRAAVTLSQQHPYVVDAHAGMSGSCGLGAPNKKNYTLNIVCLYDSTGLLLSLRFQNFVFYTY